MANVDAPLKLRGVQTIFLFVFSVFLLFVHLSHSHIAAMEAHDFDEMRRQPPPDYSQARKIAEEFTASTPLKAGGEGEDMDNDPEDLMGDLDKEARLGGSSTGGKQGIEKDLAKGGALKKLITKSGAGWETPDIGDEVTGMWFPVAFHLGIFFNFLIFGREELNGEFNEKYEVLCVYGRLMCGDRIFWSLCCIAFLFGFWGLIHSFVMIN